MLASVRLSLLGCLIVVLLAPMASAQVKVKKEKPTIETKTFDPKDPPTDAPLDGHRAATQATYRISGSMKYEAGTKKKNADGTIDVNVRPSGFELKLELIETYWLPSDADEKLKTHEAGHKKMADRFYVDAEKIARAVAKEFIGKPVSATGDDFQKAGGAAVNQAMKDLGVAYSKATTDRVKRLNAIYDELTEHGLGPMAEDDAIEAAFAKEEDEYEKANPEVKPKTVSKKLAPKAKAAAAE